MKQVSGTKEWAASNANCISGCSHDCWYCYAKTMAVRFKRSTPATWKLENPSGPKPVIGKRTGRVMFPTTHDITPLNATICIPFLKSILAKGNEVLIVSKPHFSVIEQLTKDLAEYKDKILFRFTMGSADTSTLLFWEPGAPGFKERLDSLALAHAAEFQTSVSSEPILDLDMSLLIEKTRPYITDCLWLGIMNKPFLRLKFNGAPANVLVAAKVLVDHYDDKTVKELYDRYKKDPLIKWKESIKKIVGLDIPTTKGLDI